MVRTVSSRTRTGRYRGAYTWRELWRRPVRRGLVICGGLRSLTCSTEGNAGAEQCDGLDNDCDGAVDDDLTAPAAALTSGVCAGQVKV